MRQDRTASGEIFDGIVGVDPVIMIWKVALGIGDHRWS